MNKELIEHIFETMFGEKFEVTIISDKKESVNNTTTLNEGEEKI